MTRKTAHASVRQEKLSPMRVHAPLTLATMLSLVAAGGCSDRVDPPPARIKYINVKLPGSVHDYHRYESGFRATMLQVRFQLPIKDLETLATRLPCRLGPAATGPVRHATVGTNDRSWYRPEQARRHRGCGHTEPGMSASFLVDVTDDASATVYVVVGLD